MDKKRNQGIRMDLVYHHDDFHSDPMNGQTQQNHHFYGDGDGLFRRQLLSFHRQENALRISHEKK